MSEHACGKQRTQNKLAKHAAAKPGKCKQHANLETMELCFETRRTDKADMAKGAFEALRNNYWHHTQSRVSVSASVRQRKGSAHTYTYEGMHMLVCTMLRIKSAHLLLRAKRKAQRHVGTTRLAYVSKFAVARDQHLCHNLTRNCARKSSSEYCKAMASCMWTIIRMCMAPLRARSRTTQGASHL